MNIEYAIIITLVIASGFVALKIYTIKKARYLKDLGYEIVYDYMLCCGNINYYRNKDEHIGVRSQAPFEEINANKGKWYLSKSTKKILNIIIDFYNEANMFTLGIVPYFSLEHYFAFSECEKFKEKALLIEDKMWHIFDKGFNRFLDREIGSHYYINLEDYKHNLEDLRQRHNKEFVEKELKDH